MASNTENLGLLIKDPVVDKDTTFNLETMLNENWRRIDVGLGLLAPHQNEIVQLAQAHIYAEHWWTRRPAAQNFAPMVAAAQTVDWDDSTIKQTCLVHATYVSPPQSADIYYADSVAHDIDGQVILVNPTKLVVTTTESSKASAPDNYAFLKGKYVQNNHGNVVYVPHDATLKEHRHPSYAWCFYSASVCRVLSDVPIREWESLHNPDVNAYPKNGVMGEWEYNYAGVPIDRLAFGAQIAVGEYAGTGVGGSADPNTLSFPFIPRLLLLEEKSTEGDSNPFMWWEGITAVARQGGSGTCKVSRSGNTISWYGSSAGEQYNASGTVYHYVCIG